jgi:hypothetical protein
MGGRLRPESAAGIVRNMQADKRELNQSLTQLDYD